MCPRACGADRESGQKGLCHADDKLKVARAALHFWEEPCLSGERGSGAVFFSGCPLGCVYCQNRAISKGESGAVITVERLAEIFLELQQQEAQNINLVTAGHYLPEVIEALRLSKSQGLILPIVWNSGGYETVESLRLLEGLVDIYLPDLKYLDPETAKAYSRAEDYPETAKTAIKEMVRQKPKPEFDDKGMMTSGVIVRHLVLPGHVHGAFDVLSYLHQTYGDQIYISILNQYTPSLEEEGTDPLLARKVTKREYERVLSYAGQIGIKQGFYQEGDTAEESFIPEFDCTGVLAPEGAVRHG